MMTAKVTREMANMRQMEDDISVPMFHGHFTEQLVKE